jgi:hypothetical protein
MQSGRHYLRRTLFAPVLCTAPAMIRTGGRGGKVKIAERPWAAAGPRHGEPWDGATIPRGYPTLRANAASARPSTGACGSGSPARDRGSREPSPGRDGLPSPSYSKLDGIDRIRKGGDPPVLLFVGVDQRNARIEGIPGPSVALGIQQPGNFSESPVAVALGNSRATQDQRWRSSDETELSGTRERTETRAPSRATWRRKSRRR